MVQHLNVFGLPEYVQLEPCHTYLVTSKFRTQKYIPEQLSESMWSDQIAKFGYGYVLEPHLGT